MNFDYVTENGANSNYYTSTPVYISSIVFSYILFYDIMVELPPPDRCRKGVCCMDILSSFLLSILASVIAYYICKWLDRK